MDRALREFRIRGVKTNIPFLENVVNHPKFRAGEVTTTFLDETPGLFQFRPRRDRATKLLNYLGDVMVNGNPDMRGKRRPETIRPRAATAARPNTPAPGAPSSCWMSSGPRSFAEWTRNQRQLLLTDTTFRDAHQSLLATRVRTYDMLRDRRTGWRTGMHAALQPGDVGRRDFRRVDAVPAARIHGAGWPTCGTAIPNICFQMLLRASNAVGYTAYPDNVVREFIRRSAPARASTSSASSIR